MYTGKQVVLVDVGGQRTERRKWLPSFSGVISAVIYIVYDIPFWLFGCLVIALLLLVLFVCLCSTYNVDFLLYYTPELALILAGLLPITTQC